MSGTGGEDEHGGGKPIATDDTVRSDGGYEPVDRLLTALSRRRRRQLLRYVRANEAVSVDELTEHIVDVRDDASTGGRGVESFDRTKARLVHTDLPQLRDAGIVEYDHRRGTVRYREPLRFVSEVLCLCAEFKTSPVGSE